MTAGPGIFGHDSDWQYPAITEKHAFDRMRRLLPERAEGQEFAYLGFPWATLIDLRTHAGHRSDRIARLMDALHALSARLRGHDRVVTVCQHIQLGRFYGILETAGVTDIYWSHKTRDRDRFSPQSGITLHPFPLYPVQQTGRDWQDLDVGRPWLFSFVGAKASRYYPTRTRNWIIEELRDHPKGRIVDREAWHFDRIVYDRQIRDLAGSGEPLVDDTASAQFAEIMEASTFTLCPSGTGPNSIRLWEAVMNNSVPVVLSDSYQFPGDPRLWELATVRCAEDREAIRELPDRLEAVAADPVTLHTKRLALYLLARKYGPDRFVHDILARFAS